MCSQYWHYHNNDTYHNHVNLFNLYRRMCFHHICADYIYSSSSELAPGSSLPRTDGTSSVSHSFLIKSMASRLKGTRLRKKEQDKENIAIQHMKPNKSVYCKAERGKKCFRRGLSQTSEALKVIFTDKFTSPSSFLTTVDWISDPLPGKCAG